MRRATWIIPLFLLWTLVAHGQGSQVQSGPVDPPLCDPTKGQQFFNNSTLPGVMKYCSATNTWSSLGSSSPGGSNGSVQINSSGILSGGAINDSVTIPNVVDITKDTATAGPNSPVDIRQSGARSTSTFGSTPWSTGLTANCTSGNPSLPISAASSFQNNDYVVVYGCGASHALSTPSGLTVTPSVDIAGSNTQYSTPGATTGGTSYQYQIVALTKTGGYTAATGAVSIATGQSTLGPVTVNLTSATRSNSTMTFVFSSPHGLLVGCGAGTCGMVQIVGTTDNGAQTTNTFNGDWTVVTVPNNTTVTAISNADTRTGAPTSASGGTATVIYKNHLNWTAVTNAFEYGIYGRTSGAMALIGVSKPQINSNPDPTFDDYGATMGGNRLFPAWLPTTPPGGAGANYLSAQITAGAGSTMLTVSPAPSQTISTQTIRADMGPIFKSVATALAGSAPLGSTSGALYIPCEIGTNPFFVINSYVDLSGISNLPPINQCGQLYLNAPIELRSGMKWYGNRPYSARGSQPSFCAQGNPQTVVNEAYPGVYFGTGTIGGSTLDGLYFAPGNNGNGILQVAGEGQFQITVNNSCFVTSTGTDDALGIGLYLHGAAGSQSAAFVKINNTEFSGGTNTSTFGARTGAFICDDCGATTIRDLFLVHHGVFFKGDPGGGSNLEVDMCYSQGAQEPMFQAAQLYTGYVSLRNCTNDTQLSNTVSFPNYNNGTLFVNDSINLTNTYPVGGTRLPIIGINARNGVANPGPSRSSCALVPGVGVDNINSTGFDYTGLLCDGVIAAGSTYPIIVENTTQAAPSCAVSAGGSVTLGTYTFIVMPKWGQSNGNPGMPSLPAASCTTTGGNQTLTVTWSAAQGNPVNYDVYVSTGGGFTISTSNVTGLSQVYSSGTPGGGGGMPTMPTAGPTMLSNLGVITPSSKSVTQSLAVTSADVTCGTGGTLTPCTALTTITGLSVSLPAISANWSFACDLIVSQATAAAADQIGVQTATNAPTNLAASGIAYTAAAVSTAAAITGVSSTSAQSVVTFTPGGTGTRLPIHISGTVEGASASGTTLNIMALTGSGADLLTIYRGSSCWVY